MTPARRWLPGTLALVVAAWMLLAGGVAVRDIAIYAAYLVVAVLVPGILVSRAVLGRSPLLLAELGTGGVTGLLLTLPAWALATGAGRGDLLRWWPLAVYALFVLVPPLRKHWRVERRPERLTAVQGWTLAGSVVLALLPFWDAFRRTPLLEGATQWPADLHWHLAIVELFARQVRPEDAQVAGTPLAYHWFADADMAAASLTTGVDPALVLSRLWVLPLVALTFAVLVAALRELGPVGTRAAPLAALLLAAPAGLEVFTWLDVPWDPVFAPWSPSQNYSYPFLLLIVGLVLRHLRGGPHRGLVPLGVLLLGSPGVKASTLPVILSGLALATVMALLRRGAWRRPALLSGLALGALVIGSLGIGAGGAAGSGIRVLSTLSRLPAYYESLGLDREQEAGLPTSLVPPGLEVPGMASLLALLFLAVVVKYAWVLPGLPLLRGAGDQYDAGAWVLFGGGLAGWLLMDLVDQSGESQVYFMSTGTVLWTMLAGWGTVVLLDRATARHGRWRTARWATRGAAVGVVLVLAVAAVAHVVARQVRPSRHSVPPVLPQPAETVAALRAGVVPLVVLLVLAGAYLLVLRSRRPGIALRTVAVVAGVLAASLVLNPYLSRRTAPIPAPTRSAVSPDELQAARWVADHAAPHDVVATNVHCVTPRPARFCDARAFWVSSLTRRRTFVGAWAYLDEVRARATTGGVPQLLQPFPDRARYAVNQALFEAPTSAVASVLAGQGVRWVYADRRRSRVSPALAGVADLVFRNAEVDVYELRGPAPSQSPPPETGSAVRPGRR